jgi:2-dehydropantoate 2-reductase
MRILVFGTGVIGSLYGALLAEAGYDVSVYARGRRLESLTQDGLIVKCKGEIRKVPIQVLSAIEPEDRYDLVFLTVRENQLHAALEELRQNDSPTIVTMVNSLETYDQWEAICGEGRIIPAFPGAGGGFDGNVLDAALTPPAHPADDLWENGWKRKRSRPRFPPGENPVSDCAGHARLAAVPSGDGRADRRRVL